MNPFFIYSFKSLTMARAIAAVLRSRLPRECKRQKALLIEQHISSFKTENGTKSAKFYTVVLNHTAFPDKTADERAYVTEFARQLADFTEGYLLGVKHEKKAQKNNIVRIISPTKEAAAE